MRYKADDGSPPDSDGHLRFGRDRRCHSVDVCGERGIGRTRISTPPRVYSVIYFREGVCSLHSALSALDPAVLTHRSVWMLLPIME